MNTKILQHISVLLLLVTALGGCFWKKARFDPLGHDYAKSIHEEAMEVIARAEAGKSFYMYRFKVHNLMTRVEEAYENARIKSKNDTITGIWDLMRDPQANRLGKLMQEWRIEDILLDKEKTGTMKKWIDEDLKMIASLEEGKKK